MKQYNPNKPAKYGLLYRSISDARLPYTYNTLLYAGKPNNIIPVSEYVAGTNNYTKYLVKGLQRSVDIRGRNVSMESFKVAPGEGVDRCWNTEIKATGYS